MFSKFTVITDHNPLRYLETANLGAVEQRWVAQLAELNFEVLYKPGRLNTNADALSRLPSGELPEQEDTEKDFTRMRKCMHACGLLKSPSREKLMLKWLYKHQESGEWLQLG